MKITIEVYDYSDIELLTAFFPQLKNAEDTEKAKSEPPEVVRLKTPNLRTAFKEIAKEKGLTYADIAKWADIEEETVKRFMCGAIDSRCIAEKIADVLDVSIVYKDGEFLIAKTETA